MTETRRPARGRATRRSGAAVALAAAVALGALAPACSDDAGSTEAFCEQVGRVPSLEAVLARFSEAEPSTLDDRITKAREAYHQLAEAAPSQIDGQADAVVALVDDVLDAVEAHPDDPARAAAAVRDAMADHEGVAAQRDELAAYAEAECDVVLDAPVVGDDPATEADSEEPGE